MEQNMSAVRAVDVLKVSGIEVGYDYVLELMKEIDVERTQQADQFFLNHMLVQFMERTKLTDKVLWGILTDKESTRKEKMTAAKELRHNFNTLFQTMFDAGVFKRKIGQIEIPNMNAILDMAKAIENGEHIQQTGADSSDAGDTA